MKNPSDTEMKFVLNDWGKDSLSEFLDNAQHNVMASFVNLKPEYTRLLQIHEAFKKIIENLLNIKELVPSFFLMRAHASYLGGVRFSLSGQVPEAYMVLRGCLENSLYAFHIFQHLEASEIWIRRHDSPDSLSKCKNEFRINKVFESLEKADVSVCKIARELYATTIDYGGHPNELSLTSIMSKSEDESKIDFKIPYLMDYRINPLPFILCMKSVARIGVCSLCIFRLIFRERFDILSITDSLEKLKVGL